MSEKETARKAYDEATAPARKAYDEATFQAWKAYEEAKAPARKAYEEAKAPARKAYEERVQAATRKGFLSFIKRVIRINKKPPINYANTRRDGFMEVNPRLMKEAREKGVP